MNLNKVLDAGLPWSGQASRYSHCDRDWIVMTCLRDHYWDQAAL